MTTRENRLAQQQPLPSPFTRESTAADVVSGVDLTGKTALVTGGLSGLGIPTAAALRDAGADVIVSARTSDGSSAVIPVDLSDLASVRRFTREFVDSGRAVDIVVANAGVMATPEHRVGDGHESQFAVNHLGHFALVLGLVPALNPAGSRVVMVSSAGHFVSGIRWDDLNFTHTPYDPWVAYGQSKTANALFAAELAERGRARGIEAFSLHPGNIMTNLQRHVTEQQRIAQGWQQEDGTPSPHLRLKSPEQGAATSVWAATSETLSPRTGAYLQDVDIASPAGNEDMVRGGVKPWALDPEDSSRLWDYSLEATSTKDTL